jgi:uncharacterized protein (DUF2236 family)
MQSPQTEEPLNDLATLGPESLTWKYFGDSRIAFVIGQAFVLQIAHPIIDAAVETQSSYKQDPWGRAQRSFKYLWPVVYSCPEEARQAGAFLRSWHNKIKGISAKGVAYDAVDPGAYTWVHATAYDAMVRLAEWIDGKPLADDKLDQLYEEWKTLGRLLGCAEEEMPSSRSAFQDYYAHMLQHRLEYTDSVDYWVGKTFIQHLTPPMRWIPETIWRVSMKPLSGVFDIILRVSLPKSFKNRFGISTSPAEERLYRSLIKIANAIWPVLPLRLQYVPHAWQGISESKKAPERFVHL